MRKPPSRVFRGDSTTPVAPGGGSCACLPPVRSHEVSFELFTEGDRLYDAFLGAIASARQEILLESFIFAADPVGWSLAEALIERARTGVVVRLHVDAIGSYGRLSAELVHDLRRQGVEIRWFHRWSWRRPLRYSRRNHRKLLVVDRAQAFLGGFNIHRENSRRHYGPRRWRDTHVGVHGELAAQAAVYFDWLWQGAGPIDTGALPDHPAAIPGALLIATPSRRCRRRLLCVYERLFDEARRFVYITTPYFGPGRRLRDALCRTARRGVDARLLVPARSDPLVAGWVTRSSYDALLRAGVRIHEYRPRRLHAKTAVVDGAWASVGSVNLDELSLLVNQELLLLARSSDLAAELRASFLRDLVEADEITASEWARRSSRERLLEQVGRALRPLT